MAYIVVSQHTYKDKLLQFVTMLNDRENFNDVISSIQDYITEFNNDVNIPYTAVYESIENLTVSKLRPFTSGRPLLNMETNGSKGGYLINFVVRLYEPNT